MSLPSLLNVYMDNMLCYEHRLLYPKDDLYFRISQVFMGGDIACDRFNILHEHSKYRWGNIKSSRPSHTDRDFKEICLEHAKELVDKYPKIGVLWSGGVDSTALIFILLLAGLKKENLLVICNDSSIHEAPEIFKYLLDNEFEIQYFNKQKWLFDGIDDLPVDLVLTGSNADQLFCRGYLVKQKNVLDIIQKPWKDRLREEYCVEPVNLHNYADTDIALFEYYQGALNWQCETWAELSNMVNFCFHWEYVTRFFKSGSAQNKCSKTQGFYITQDMQNWTYSNRRKLAEYTYKVQQGQHQYYKKELKDIIREYTGIDSYYFNKLKGDSIKFYKRDVRPPYYPFNIIDTKGSKLIIFPTDIDSTTYVKSCLTRLSEYLK